MKFILENKDRKYIVLYTLLFVFSLIFLLQLLRYFNLNSRIADLGFFESNSFSIYIEPARSIFGHFQPFLFFFGIFYKLFPGNIAICLIFAFQNILIAYSLYLLYKYYGFITYLMVLVSPPLWFLCINDFHIDFMVLPISTVFFILTKKNNLISALLISLIFILIKETYILLIASCSIYIFFINQNKSKIISLLSILFFIFGIGLYFIVNIYILDFLIPDYFFNSLGNSVYSGSGSNIYYRLLNIISNISNIFLDIDKIKYILLLLSFFVFIPIISLLPLVVALPIILISLLSNNPGYYSISNHYTAGIIIPLAVSFYYGYNKLLKRFNISIYKIIILFSLILHILFSPSPISRYWWNKSTDYSYINYTLSERNNIIRNAILTYIPINKEITLTSINSLNYYVLSNRLVYLPFNLGLSKPYIQPNFSSVRFIDYLNYINDSKSNFNNLKYISDFIIIDLNRKIYLIDKGCDLNLTNCSDQYIHQEFMYSFNQLPKYFDLIFSYDNFYIYKRK